MVVAGGCRLGSGWKAVCFVLYLFLFQFWCARSWFFGGRCVARAGSGPLSVLSLYG